MAKRIRDPAGTAGGSHLKTEQRLQGSLPSRLRTQPLALQQHQGGNAMKTLTHRYVFTLPLLLNSATRGFPFPSSGNLKINDDTTARFFSGSLRGWRWWGSCLHCSAMSAGSGEHLSPSCRYHRSICDLNAAVGL